MEEIQRSEIFPPRQRSASTLKRELKKRKKKWWRGEKLRSKFKEVDLYGEQVSLTYKGEQSFKTMPGAIVSVVVILVILAFSIYRCIAFVTRSDPSLSKQSFMRDLDSEKPLVPNEFGFNIGFGLRRDIDPTYGKFMVQKVSQNYVNINGNRTRVRTREQVEYQYCGNDSTQFQGLNSTKVAMYGIPILNCFKNLSDFSLQGDFYSESFSYIQIMLQKCTNTTKYQECKSDEEIDQYFKHNTISLAIINSYFDYTDYTIRPLDQVPSESSEIDENGSIRQYIDDRFFMDIEGGRNKKANIFLKKSVVQLQDDYIQLGQKKEIEFIEIENSRFYDDQVNVQNRYIAQIYIRYDGLYNIYSRQIYSITAFLGDIGGMYQSIYFIGFMLVAFFTHRLFISAILKQLYQIKDFKDELPAHQRLNFFRRLITCKLKTSQNSNKLQPLNTEQEVLHQNTERKNQHNIMQRMKSQYNSDVESLDIVQTRHSPMSKSAKVERESTQNIESLEKTLKDPLKVTLDQREISVVLRNVINRRRFQYTCSDILEFLVRCLCLRRIKKRKYRGSREEWEDHVKKHYHFKEGEDKLFDELDVITLLKSMRRVKLLTQTLLTQSQKMVLRFQRKNIIESSSSSGDSDTNNRFDQMNLMESRNPMMRLSVFAKIKKIMNGYVDSNLTEVDRRVLRGLFVKNLKDFDEEHREKMAKKTLSERLDILQSSSKMIQFLMDKIKDQQQHSNNLVQGENNSVTAQPVSLINRGSLMSQMKKRPELPATPDGMNKVNIFASILKASSNNPITAETELINEEEDHNNPQEIDQDEAFTTQMHPQINFNIERPTTSLNANPADQIDMVLEDIQQRRGLVKHANEDDDEFNSTFKLLETSPHKNEQGHWEGIFVQDFDNELGSQS